MFKPFCQSRFWLISCLLIALLGIQDDAFGQKKSPEETIQEYVSYMGNLDYEGMAEAMHPEALQEFSEFLVDLVTMDSSGMFLALFLGLDADEVAEKQPVELFALFMGNVMGLEPEVEESLKNATIDPIGHVMEGDDVAHVVYRMNMPMEGATINKITVASMKRYEKSWRMLLTGDVDELMQALRGQLGP